jgi:Alpha galactosidase A/NPCBM/NEW2 domain/Alpha galactosidase C-terminal beta sandwich domain/NPCBM-associated, NEW3 domain of alpha-galactosidase
MLSRRGLAALGCALTSLALAAPAAALDNGLAATPPMGYNDWNAFGCNVSESLIEATALAIHQNGMQDAGYQYVNIDDCWLTHSRDAGGHLVPDTAKFPDGIKGTADYVHSLGLKLGIYEDAGSMTCAGYPGSYGHETTDAQDFANWGVDYLKYDNCNIVAGTGDTQQEFIDRYSRMRDALLATGRPIVYSLCEWGQQSPWLWGANVGNLWRTTGDISDNYASMLGIVQSNAALADAAGPGHWNDPDMLEVGNGGMTDAEYRSHFSLWSIMSAPLLAGTDLRNPSPATLQILENKDVIAIDQDPLGKQGRVLSSADGHWVFAKPLQNGDVAVALFNETASAAPVQTTATAAGLPQNGGYVLHDLWQHAATETSGTIGAYVPAHGTVMYRVVADPNWASYPPATSLAASVSAPAQGANGQYVVPGQPFKITGTISNYGGVTGAGATLKLTGPSAYDGVSYEAEAPTSTRNGAVALSSCDGCSGGQKVGFIGNGAGNWVRLNGISVATSGTYDLTVYAAVSGTRSLFMSVDGGPGVEVPVTGTSFGSPTAVKVSVALAADANTLRFYNDTAYGPDLDRVVLGGGGAPSGWTISPADPVSTPQLGAGQSLSVDWTVTPPKDAGPGTYHLTVEGQLGSATLTAPITVVVPAAQLQTGYLSDQQWLEAQNFWGPVERDTSNGEQAAGDGHTITIGGKTYAKGLGVHAPSTLLFYNGEHCSSLTADVGVDDEKSGAGSVEFQVWADSRLVADSGVVTWQDAAKTLTANIGNSEFVQLVVLDGGDTNSDHADWAGVQVTCGGQVGVSGGVGGTVPATLALTLGGPAAFGAFTPGVAKDYLASMTANVISTAGDATLSVADPSPVATGHLVNGAFALPQALQAKAASPAGSGGDFAPLGTLLTYGGPVSNDPVTVTFKQSIGATDPLRTGAYSKTLTFTLSTTSP